MEEAGTLMLEVTEGFTASLGARRQPRGDTADKGSLRGHAQQPVVTISRASQKTGQCSNQFSNRLLQRHPVIIFPLTA